MKRKKHDVVAMRGCYAVRWRQHEHVLAICSVLLWTLMSVSLHYLVKHKVCVCVCVQSMKRKKHDVVATRGRGDVLALTAARACARNLLCIATSDCSEIDVCDATTAQPYGTPLTGLTRPATYLQVTTCWLVLWINASFSIFATLELKSILLSGVVKCLIGFPVILKLSTLIDPEMPFYVKICFHRRFDWIFLPCF